MASQAELVARLQTAARAAQVLFCTCASVSPKHHTLGGLEGSQIKNLENPSVAGALSELGQALFGSAKDANDSTADATKQITSELSLVSNILNAVGTTTQNSDQGDVKTEEDQSRTCGLFMLPCAARGMSTRLDAFFQQTTEARRQCEALAASSIAPRNIRYVISSRG